MEIHLVKESKWFYKLVSAGNHKTIMVSETFYSKWNAKRAARKVAKANLIPFKES